MPDPESVVRAWVDEIWNRGRLERASRSYDMGQQRPTGERLQHLRQRGIHALALPGGKNDYGDRRQTEDLEDR